MFGIFWLQERDVHVVDPYREKNDLRDEMERLRRRAGEESRCSAALACAGILRGHGAIVPNTVVASYRPIRGELDPEPLAQYLRETGCRIALPVVAGKRQPLMFRAYVPGDELAPGYAGILEPLPRADALSPDVFLVPLLAFDRAGNRLGYGGGFYDRTLALARLCKRVTALGLAYACQEIARVPQGLHDVRLDAVATEKEFIKTVR